MSSSCPHPIVYQGLCAACGLDLTKQPKQSTPSPSSSSSSSPQSRSSSLSSSPPSSPSRSSSSSSAPHAIVLGGAHKTIHFSSAALIERTRSNTLELLTARRMICVLDLDHTLLHATSDDRIRGYIDKEPDLHKFHLGHAPFQKTHYVKLRPGLQEFLGQVSKLMDLHVYTMGVRAYADAVVPIFDPTHRFIKHRVVSRDESSNNHRSASGAKVLPHQAVKSLKLMYPCDEGLICIVDDRTDVWNQNAKNVVRTHEFMYFSGRGGEMNARPKGEGDKERERNNINHEAALPIFPYQFATHPYPDNVLTSVTAVLQAVHTLFYRQVDEALKPGEGETKPSPVSDLFPLSADMAIPRLISLIKQTTLAGCVIVFSGVFPMVRDKDNNPSGKSGARQAEAWIAATAYGAICLEDFPDRVTSEDHKSEEDYVVPFGTDSLKPPPRVTHVVAARDGSAKLQYVASLPEDTKPHCVHVSWLWHSLAHFQRGDEKLFPLWSEKNNVPKTPTVANTTASTTPTASTSTHAASPALTLTSTSNVEDEEEKDQTFSQSQANTAAITTAATVTSQNRDKTPDPFVPSSTSSKPTELANTSSSQSTASAAAVVPSSSSASSSSSSTMQTVIVGGLRRRVAKKPSNPVPPTSSPSPATSAVSSTAPSSFILPSTSAPVTPISSDSISSHSPSTLPSDAAADRYSFHLVHHSRRPITSIELVRRVESHLNQLAEERRQREVVGDQTIVVEKEKADHLKQSQRRRKSVEPSLAKDVDGDELLTDASANVKSRAGRKSVTFYQFLEIGPTNPHYHDDDVKPQTSHTNASNEAPFSTPSPSPPPVIINQSMKRKAQLPLDDVDRRHKSKERKIVSPEENWLGMEIDASVSSDSDSSINEEDFDLDDVLDLDPSHNAHTGETNSTGPVSTGDDNDGFGLPNGLAHFTRGGDSNIEDSTGQQIGEEEDPFQLGEDCFDDQLDYGENEAYQDDE